MGRAVTTKAINGTQIGESFPNCAVFVYGSYDAGAEKTVEVREYADEDIASVLDAYTFDPDYGRPVEDVTLRDDLRTQLDSLQADLTTNWPTLDAAGRIAALRTGALLSVRIARFILRRLLA